MDCMGRDLAFVYRKNIGDDGGTLGNVGDGGGTLGNVGDGGGTLGMVAEDVRGKVPMRRELSHRT